MLIQLDTLRRGNWLFDESDEHYCVFEEMSGLNIKLNRFGKTPYIGIHSFLKPIPITRGKLSVCGFRPENDKYYITTVAGKRISLRFVDNGIVQLLFEKKESENISSVHELQNEYFFLTGEELKVNLIGI